jgi:hypothetical protein
LHFGADANIQLLQVLQKSAGGIFNSGYAAGGAGLSGRPVVTE